MAKIKSLATAFEKLGNAEASAEYKFLKRAENLYLKAAEKAGDARLIRYITSGEWDEEEAEYAKKRQKNGWNKVVDYIPEKTIPPRHREVIQVEVYRLYSGVDNAIADGIAFEVENAYYVIDSGRENGRIRFAYREKHQKKDDNARIKFVRRINDDAISKGHVDVRLAGRLRDRYTDNSGSDGRQGGRLQLQTAQGEPQHNQGGVSAKNEKSSKNIIFYSKKQAYS